MTAWDGKDLGRTIVADSVTIQNVPPVFQGLQTASAGDQIVQLEWLSASDPSPPILYNIYMAESPGGQNFDIPYASTYNTVYDVTPLQNNRAYYFVVRAEDRRGNEDSNLIEKESVPQSESFQPIYEGYMAGLRLPGLYSGGGNFGKPAITDIDNDGDNDILMGQGDGTLTFWENTGTENAPSWNPPYRNYAGIDVNVFSAPTFGDIDNDGDKDLLVGKGDGSLILYPNVGTRNTPGWGLGQENFAEIDVSAYSAPSLGDLDNDGDLDLIVGCFGGTLDFKENLGNGNWGPQLGNYAGVFVGTNSIPFLVDIDGDADLDILVGNGGGSISLMENTGTPDSPAWDNPQEDNWQSILVDTWSAPAVADMNNDNLPDLFVGDRYGRVISYLSGPTGITAESGNFDFIDIGDYSAPAFGDIDNDGDPDLFLGGANGQLFYLENVGNPLAPRWSEPVENFGGIDVGSYSAPCLFDLNGDGFLDLLIGEQEGNVNYYQYDPLNSTFNLIETHLAGIDVGYYSTPCIINNDGVGDLLVGEYGGTLTFCENVGSASSPTWDAPVSNYQGIDVGSYSVPFGTDINHDSFVDLFIGNNEGTLMVYETESSPLWTTAKDFYAGIDVGEGSYPTLADIDGDGDSDLAMGESEGGLNLWRNMTFHLKLKPHNVTVVEGSSVTFKVYDRPAGDFKWEIVNENSGAVLSATDTNEIIYTAGPSRGLGKYDVIEVKDISTPENYFARAHVNVVREEDLVSTGKAIICAGRKGSNDSVWPASNYLSQLAYKTLLLKGFKKTDIYFLSPEVNQDVDENGDATDDIDAESTFSNLKTAISWASGVEDLTIFMVDHGWQEAGEGRFRINEGNENILTSKQLDFLLDNLQTNADTKITLIIDSCNSGSFLPDLIPPTNKARVVVTSCGENEVTYFLLNGLVSFSEVFWNSINSGINLKSAFDLAVDGMNRYQSPKMDDNGDGLYNQGTDGDLALLTEIGRPELGGGDRPQIGSVVSNQVISDETSVTLWASDISAVYPIDKVWAIIVQPNFFYDPEASNPVIDVATLEFQYDNTLDIYHAVLEDVTQTGTYKVIFYARDIYNSVSLPKQVYIHKTEFTEKVILIVGEGRYDDDEEPWENSNFLGNYAYQTFLNRWFGKDDIYYFNPLTNQDVDGNGFEDDVDGPPVFEDIQNRIMNDCLGADKLTFYFIGQGATDSLKLNDTKILSSTQLDSWLDTLQTSNDTEVYVVLESKKSGTFADDLIAPSGKERILITSAAPGYDSYCDAGGIFSFSQFFLGRIYEGDDIRKAFVYGQPAISYITRGRQVPGLSADGNEIMNEKTDGVLAKNKYIGPGFLTGGDDLPTILEVAEDVFLTSGEVTSTVWCSGVFDSDGIKNVTAEIVPPDWPVSSITELPLVFNGSQNRYEETCAQFTEPGDYRILYTAEDGEDNISAEKTGIVYQYTTADIYEVDDTTEEASLIVVDWGESQKHNFHDYGDTDWAWFLALPESSYTINAGTPAITADLVLTLYHESDWSVPYIEVDSGYDGDPESYVLDVTTENQGVYYVNVKNYYPEVYGAGICYELEVNKEYGLENGWAEPQSPTQMLITWTPSENVDLLGYQIFRSLEYNRNYEEISNVVGSVTGYFDEGLSPSTTYYYQIYEIDTRFQKRFLTQPFFNTTFEESLTVDVQITSTTPATSQVLTIGEICNIESMISYLSNEDGLNLLISLWNNTGSFESLPLVPLTNSPAWENYSASFSNILISDNGDVVLKAQVLNDSPTPTVLAEDFKTFPVVTPTPITLSAPFWNKYR